MNLARRSYCKKFEELLEEQLDQIEIEDELFQVMNSLLSKQTLEKIDNNITHVLNVVWKKIEGPTRIIPYSKTKAIHRAYLLFWKTKKKQAQNKYVDVLTIEKRKEQAGIGEIEALSIQ